MAIGLTLVVQRFISFTFFLLIRFLFIVVQRIFWELNGTGRRLRECTDPRYYERSAQVLDVVMEHHFCEAQPHSTIEFICVHNRFENPQFIIDNEHVTLYAINDKNAVFVVTKDKDMRLWKSEFSSFMFMAQRTNCHQLIVVPLPVFHQLAERIGDPKGKLTFIINTARCGSTLLTQIMEHTGRCVALSEPFAINFVAVKYVKQGFTPELRQLTRDVIRWECRPYPSMKPPPLAYVLKVTALAAVGLPLFVDLFPSSRNLFMYRDVVKASKSVYRITYNVPSWYLIYKLGRLSVKFSRGLLEAFGFHGEHLESRFLDDMDMGISMNCFLMKTYLDVRDSGKVDIAGIRYEDLVGKPSESVRQILEFIGLPVELVESGLSAIQVDSQKNSSMAKFLIGWIPEPEMTPESVARANDKLKKNGLPLIGEEMVLEGTITYYK